MVISDGNPKLRNSAPICPIDQIQSFFFFYQSIAFFVKRFLSVCILQQRMILLSVLRKNLQRSKHKTGWIKMPLIGTGYFKKKIYSILLPEHMCI